MLKSFLSETSGAVTVDWVVLTAAVEGLGVATVGAVRNGTQALGSDVSASLTSASVVSLGTLGSTGVAAAPWAPGAWTQHNPGVYDSYVAWMTNFTDVNLLTHMNNMAQYADLPPNSGHPLDTYHDEYHIARDEAISRGLIQP